MRPRGLAPLSATLEAKVRLTKNAMCCFPIRIPRIKHNVLLHEVRSVERVVNIEDTFQETPAVTQPTIAFDMSAEQVPELFASLSLQDDNAPWGQL